MKAVICKTSGLLTFTANSCHWFLIFYNCVIFISSHLMNSRSSPGDGSPPNLIEIVHLLEFYWGKRNNQTGPPGRWRIVVNSHNIFSERKIFFQWGRWGHEIHFKLVTMNPSSSKWTIRATGYFPGLSDALWIALTQPTAHTHLRNLDRICLCWILLFRVIAMKWNRRWSPAGITNPQLCVSLRQKLHVCDSLGAVHFDEQSVNFSTCQATCHCQHFETVFTCFYACLKALRTSIVGYKQWRVTSKTGRKCVSSSCFTKTKLHLSEFQVTVMPVLRMNSILELYFVKF